MAPSKDVSGDGRKPDPLSASALPQPPVRGKTQPAEPGISVEQAVALREQAPELYDLWLKIAQEKAATANYVDRAPYEVPERLARSGRPRALGALIVVLSFCGYLAWLGGPGPYIAGVIAILDLCAMLGIFFGLRPDHLSGPRRAGRKPLPVVLRLCATAEISTAARWVQLRQRCADRGNRERPQRQLMQRGNGGRHSASARSCAAIPAGCSRDHHFHPADAGCIDAQAQRDGPEDAPVFGTTPGGASVQRPGPGCDDDAVGRSDRRRLQHDRCAGSGCPR